MFSMEGTYPALTGDDKKRIIPKEKNKIQIAVRLCLYILSSSYFGRKTSRILKDT
jgi:hypothetical protein